MKKKTNLMVPIMIIVLLSGLTSCNLPTSNNQNTQPPVEATTPPPPGASPSAEVSEGTPEPLAGPDFSSLVPVTGSILKWIDLSDFVFVPEGSFTMGQDSEAPTDYAPSHAVTLAGFWIQQAEVTNQQYAQCVADGKCSAPNQEPKVPYWFTDFYKASNPVVGVTWQQATEYCESIHGRLPSEAEWEKAARGSELNPYPWGEEDPNCSLLNFDDCLNPSEPQEVRAYNNGASEFKAMDMSGNVFEWVADWYAEDYYAASPDTNPTGPAEGTQRIFRGGGYASPADQVNVFTRFAAKPEEHAADRGFRCVLLGDPTKSTTETVGQPCQILGSSDQLETQPTYTPYPCEQATVLGYCELLGGKASYGVDIRQNGCLSNKLNSMTGNSQPLNCTVHQLQNGGNQYLCTFPGMAQGIDVEVRFCHSFSMQIVKLKCPTGYKLVQPNSICELEYAKLPAPPCPKGYLDVPPNGCMPVNDPNNGGCPVGFYSMVSPLTSVCMPMNSCTLSNAPESCSNPTCAEGEFYDAAKGCCASPDTPKMLCPANLLYNADLNACIGSNLYPKDCPVVQTKIPLCPTLTPTPTTPPQGGGQPGSNCYWDTGPTHSVWVCP